MFKSVLEVKGISFKEKVTFSPPGHAPENNGKLLDQQEEKNDFSGFFFQLFEAAER